MGLFDGGGGGGFGGVIGKIGRELSDEGGGGGGLGDAFAQADFLIGGASTAANIVTAQKEAQASRKFARRFAATAWQRTVRDLNKAGLNPLIALSSGATGLGSGAVAQLPNFAQSVSAPVSAGAAARSATAAGVRADTERAQLNSNLLTAKALRAESAARELKERNQATIHARELELLQPQVSAARELDKLWRDGRYRNYWREVQVNQLRAQNAAAEVDAATGGLMRGGSGIAPRLDFWRK